ncbi:MAG: Gfo/Idh/MocA family protein [Gaiellaceae bacterium]
MRAGVVGLGVGEAHARAYADAGCALTLYDHDATRAEALAAELGAEAVDSYDDLVAASDVVSIASFDDDHFEQARAALRAGRHVFCEKPLCRTVDEVRSLKEALAPGLVLASNLVLRRAPFFAWLHGARAELGDVYAFDGDYLYGRLHKLTDGWRKDAVDYSVLLGGGVHLIDLMLWLTGERPVRVSTVGNRISTEGTAFRFLDFGAATFTFRSGLVGRITANFGAVIPHRHVVRMFGTKATAVSDDAGVRLYRSREPEVEPERVPLSPLPPSKGALIADFLAAVGGTRAMDPGADHEFALIDVCAAANRALEEGRDVDIDYT